MKHLPKALVCCFAYFTLGISTAFATLNQTDDLSPILPGSQLPFRVSIELANFQLPTGFHSGAVGIFQNYWIFIAGRVNGMHGFGNDPFPADQQNTRVYVVNSTTGAVSSRSLLDRSSGLNQKQIDALSVTSPEMFQDGTTLYMTGGYGIDTATATFQTQPVLTAFNLPGIVEWVIHPENTNNTILKNMTQIYDPLFQVTGGRMYKLGNTMQLVFGQTFTGVYTSGSNGTYSQQIRKFQLNSTNGQLTVSMQNPVPNNPNPNYRRRDMNIVPVLLNKNNTLEYGLVAYSGVFTVPGGIWTVPVIIDQDGNPSMADPSLPTTFKQGMNNYACATAGLYSRKNASMYNIFFGGLSYEFYSGGTFQVDAEVPFINQVTTIKIDRDRNFTQYLMDAQYPTILSTTVNPGNTMLFGAGSYFVPSNISQYPNRVLNLDTIRSATVIGYIVGGIQSTVGNTSVPLIETFASPYIFKVTLTPT